MPWPIVLMKSYEKGPNRNRLVTDIVERSRDGLLLRLSIYL
jgi:hypothetical protein